MRNTTLALTSLLLVLWGVEATATPLVGAGIVSSATSVAGGASANGNNVFVCNDGVNQESATKWILFLSCDVSVTANSLLLGDAVAGSKELVDLTSTFRWNLPYSPGYNAANDRYQITRKFDGTSSVNTSAVLATGAVAHAHIVHGKGGNPPEYDIRELSSLSFGLNGNTDVKPFEFVNFSRGVNLYPPGEIRLGGYVFAHASATGIGAASAESKISFQDILTIEWFPGQQNSLSPFSLAANKSSSSGTTSDSFIYEGSLSELESKFQEDLEADTLVVSQYVNDYQKGESEAVPEPSFLLAFLGLLGFTKTLHQKVS